MTDFDPVAMHDLDPEHILARRCPGWGVLSWPFLEEPLALESTAHLIVVEQMLNRGDKDAQILRAIAAILGEPGGENVPVLRSARR